MGANRLRYIRVGDRGRVIGDDCEEEQVNASDHGRKVYDPKNGVNGVADVISRGKIAAGLDAGACD